VTSTGLALGAITIQDTRTQACDGGACDGHAVRSPSSPGICTSDLSRKQTPLRPTPDRIGIVSFAMDRASYAAASAAFFQLSRITSSMALPVFRTHLPEVVILASNNRFERTAPFPQVWNLLPFRRGKRPLQTSTAGTGSARFCAPRATASLSSSDSSSMPDGKIVLQGL